MAATSNKDNNVKISKLQLNIPLAPGANFIVHLQCIHCLEGQILAELLEISEQRELLQSMLSKDRARYQQEDMAIEEQMKASGLRIN